MSGGTADSGGSQPAITAREKIQYAAENRLVSWINTQLGIDVQIVVPDEHTGRELAAQIQREHPGIKVIGVRQSNTQGGRWVVQTPVWQADDARLLPGGVSARHIQSTLPQGPASGNVTAYRQMHDEILRTRQRTLSRTVQGVGLAQGILNATQAYQRGDVPATALAAGDATVSGLGLATEAAHVLGKAVPPGITTSLNRANVVLAVADGAYHVSRETGMNHKLERATAVAATAGVGLGTTVALGGTLAAEGLVAATAGAVAPVAVAAAAAYGTAVIAETVIDTRRIYETLDQAFKPSGDLRHLRSVGLRLREQQAEHLKGDQQGQVDLNDPENLNNLRSAIQVQKLRLNAQVLENSSFLPRWLRWGRKLDRYNDARSELAIYQAAEQELMQHEQHLTGQLPREVAPADPSTSLARLGGLRPAGLPAAPLETANKPRQR